VNSSRIAPVGFLVAMAACSAAPKPKVFGTAPNLTPAVQVVGNDRLPLHLRIDPAQPSYVTAFYVVPGEGTLLLYPADSTGSKLMPAGAQEVTTSLAMRSVVDTNRLLRRAPRGQQSVPSGAPQGVPGQGRGSMDMTGAFVLVYASADSLAYKTLNERVIGVSLPGYTDEAFNTVTKLIRSAASGSGAWSAIAVPFGR
jgi:hypothetical protein